ncbi:MAG: XdhC family protein [Pseudomonadota bacterium]
MSEPTRASDHDALQTAFAAAERWLARDGQVATATVINTWGSAPVPIGGQMVVARDGTFFGSVSGGCVEGEVIAAAEDVLESGKPETLQFGVTDESAWSVGLPCGGQIDVFIERLDRDGDAAGWIERARAAQSRRDGLVIATDLDNGGKRLFVRGDSADAPDHVTQRFRSGKSALVPRDQESGPGARVFYQAVLPPARIVVIGATHIAQLLSEMGRLAGYEMIVVDPRTAFASGDRFAHTDVRAEWPQDALPTIGLDAYTAVAVVAHVSHIDDEALKIALGSECLYIGALGSKRNHEKRCERLAAEGFDAETLARIACPIGLDIGAQTPAEIATAILAEIILAVRGAKRGASGSGARPDLLAKHHLTSQ